MSVDIFVGKNLKWIKRKQNNSYHQNQKLCQNPAGTWSKAIKSKNPLAPDSFHPTYSAYF